MPGDPGTNINRYSDLVSAIPRGEFFSTTGTPIPYQGSKPYDLVLQTSQALRIFGIFVNEHFKGTVNTDDQGIARFSVLLDLGRNDIVLEDDETGQRLRTYLDAKVMHTFHAALAEIFENIDENIQDTFNDRRLEAAERGEIEDVWGEKLLHPNSPGYQHETYREMLQEIHQGYRMFGGRRHGLDNVVSAVTTVTPLVIDLRSLGWILGTSFLRNAEFQDRNRTQFTRASAIPSVVSIDSIGSANQLGAGTITYTAVGTTMQWTTPGGAIGPAVDVSAGGQFTLPGVALVAQFDGRTNGPFNIVAATNDQLRLNIDGLGSIDITLTAGAARTAAQIATDINTALTGDVRYGAGYAAAASTLTTQRVRISSVVTGESGTVLLENISADAYFTVFGYPWIRNTLTGVEGIGSTTLNLTSSDVFPDSDPDTGTYRVLIARNTIREEMIEVIDNDRTTDILTTVAGGLTIAKVGGDTVEIEGSFSHLQVGSDNEEQGIVITVDETLLAANDTETVTLVGSDTPDYWLADNASTVNQLEYGFFDFQQLALTNDGTGDTTLEAEADPRVFEFKEWPFTFSMWVRNRHTASINVRLGVNFGSGWVETGDFAIPSMNANGGDAMTFISQDTVLPATATQFRVRIRHNGAGAGQILEVAQAKLSAPNVTAASLGINTVPRSEHRGYLGEAVYVWSPVVLSDDEGDLIGLNSPTPPGHIDYVVPAHVQADRFDVSEYSLGDPINIRGSFTEAELFSGTLTNLDLTIRTPSRRSYLRPTRVSRVEGEALTFPSPPVAPFTTTLAVISNMDQDNALLYEDGVLVPNSDWQFNSSSVIEVISSFNSGAEYTIDYDALIQWETTEIDLGATFADHVWYVDTHLWTRFEPELMEVQRTIQLLFNTASRRASLFDRSNQDKTESVLVENDGLVVRTIASSKYRYLDSRTVQIDPDVFKTTSLYFLTYTSLRSNAVQVPSVTVEVRQSTDSIVWTSYVEVQKDDVLPGGYRYLGYRITIGDVVDLRDVRISSASAKGLNLFGTGGTVPILRA